MKIIIKDLDSDLIEKITPYLGSINVTYEIHE